MQRYSKFFIILFLHLTIFSHVLADEYRAVPGVIHLDSNVSGGDYSIEKLVTIAETYGQEIVIITDHDHHEATYGIWPLQNIIKKTIKHGSIKSYGAERYIADMEASQKAHPNVTIIHGTEAIPFYYWEGSFRDRNNLRLINFHKHLLVIGLEDVEDYENLPSIAQGFSREFSTDTIFAFWPLAFIIFGLWLLIKKCREKMRYGGQSYVNYSWINIIFCVFSFLIGILFTINNFPFVPQKYDQYSDYGIEPYQEMIDYVNSKGGMTFWAHPEVEQVIDVDGIELYTKPYYEDLLLARNYTGFAAFYEGMKQIGKPDGIWDKILVEYCKGKREKPIWAIGEVDFEGGGFADKVIKETQTFFLLKEKSRESVLEALREGRMYATRNINDELFLNEFSISNFAGNTALMGEELDCSASPKITIIILDNRQRKRSLKVELIRMGKIIKTFDANEITNIDYTDHSDVTEKKIYYRLIISQGDTAKIVSNPIFVNFSR